MPVILRAGSDGSRHGLRPVHKSPRSCPGSRSAERSLSLSKDRSLSLSKDRSLSLSKERSLSLSKERSLSLSKERSLSLSKGVHESPLSRRYVHIATAAA